VEGKSKISSAENPLFMGVFKFREAHDIIIKEGKMEIEKLAIHGGRPIITKSLPVIENSSGRDIGKEELQLVTEVIKSGSLNYLFGGTKVDQFEKDFAKKYGLKNAVASSSGTAAIHVALNTIEINPGDEVIVPPITDGGTIIPILYQNAIPVFADIEAKTYNIDYKSIEERITEKTKAIIVVHLLGQACDMDPILQIAKEKNIWIIEDCAQAFLTKYKGKLVGTLGDFGCFSFQQSKHITTGDGGMTITKHDDLAKRMRMCSDKGWPRGEIFRDYLFLAPNYHMTELQGAVGIAQLRKLDRIINNRIESAKILTDLLKGNEYISVPYIDNYSNHTYWKYPIEINPDLLKVSVEEFGQALSAEGVPSWAGYIKKPLYLFDFLYNKKTYGNTKCPFTCPLYGKNIEYKKGLCPTAEDVLKRLIVLHWSEKYTQKNVYDIKNAIQKVVNYYVS